MHMTRLACIALLTFGLTACTGDNTVDRTAIGAGGGALVGGALGSLSGNFGWGALIGAGAGAAGGLLYDYNQRTRGH